MFSHRPALYSISFSEDRWHRLIKVCKKLYPVILLDSQDKGDALLGIGAKASLTARGGQVTIKTGKQTKLYSQNPWKSLRQFRERFANDWLLGYLGYDLKNYIENIRSENPPAINLPDSYVMVPVWLFSYSVKTEKLHLLTGDKAKVWDFITLHTKMKAEKEPAPEIRIDPANPAEKEHFTNMVKQAKKAIYEGDYYEINLSRKVEGSINGDVFELYRSMKKLGPVPFGAYLSIEGSEVCCASPERFLKKNGRVITSEPIKGTAGIGETVEENEQIKQELAASEKNRAENLMIVDLVRHDFSRICAPGSVRVPSLFLIKRYPTVFQMVSEIEGELLPGKTMLDSLEACFPMGSMTGAPKLSAMQDIERLENYKRGLYSGAIGYISPEDDGDFNVVIRTAVCESGKLIYCTGGAITSGSEPADEWEETITKCRALQIAVGASAGIS
ncbi:MAG: anthranilate synthase component I family protein [Balneolales bacterium]|nr:anthranilate synthase component I family protein [Balneolales bacterium]